MFNITSQLNADPTRLTPARPEPVLLDVPGAGRMLGVSERTVWTLISQGALESVRVGRMRRIPVRAIEAFVLRQEREEQAIRAAAFQGDLVPAEATHG